MIFKKYVHFLPMLSLISLLHTDASAIFGCCCGENEDRRPTETTRLLGGGETSAVQEQPRKKEQAKYVMSMPMEPTDPMKALRTVLSNTPSTKKLSVNHFSSNFPVLEFHCEPKNAIIFLHFLSLQDQSASVISPILTLFQRVLETPASTISQEVRVSMASAPLAILHRIPRQCLEAEHDISTIFAQTFTSLLGLEGKMTAYSDYQRTFKVAMISVTNFGTVYVASGTRGNAQLEQIEVLGNCLSSTYH